jgi:hypothetical protein
MYIEFSNMLKTIALNDALGAMELGTPFQIKFVTADRTRKIGGNIIDLKKCVMVGAAHNQKNNDTITVKQVINNGHPYPIHIHLITEFNNQKVFI